MEISVGVMGIEDDLSAAKIVEILKSEKIGTILVLSVIDLDALEEGIYFEARTEEEMRFFRKFNLKIKNEILAYKKLLVS